MANLCNSYNPNYPNSMGSMQNTKAQGTPQTQGQTKNMQTRTTADSNVPSLTAAQIPMTSATPTTVQNPYYTAGFLRNYLGRNMRVEFLIGTSGALVDRVGVLMEVGASYIVLQPYLTDDLLMCDLYSIKFVTIYG